MLKLLSSLVIVSGIVTSTAPPELRRDDLMTELRKGGYTIVLRHARTNRSAPTKENPSYIPPDRADQRNLTDDGVRDAKMIGAVLSKYRIPIGEVISSPMFRTIETAEFASHKKPVTTMVLRTFPTTPEQAALLAAPVKAGENRLLVTHHFIIEAHVPGISPGDIGESEAVVIRRTANAGVEIVGRISLADWEALSGNPATPGNATGAVRVSQSEVGQPSTVLIATTMPDTPAGKLASAYITAFNSGTAVRMREFIESYMVPNPARSTEERAKSYENLYATYGTLSLDGVFAASDSEVTVGVTSKQGKLRLIVKKKEGERDIRAASVTFATLEGGGHR